MPDLISLFRHEQLCRRVYEKRMECIEQCEFQLRHENAIREEIKNNMRVFVATALQCRYRGWKGRCIASIIRHRHLAAIQIQRIGRGLIGRRLAARERRQVRQVLRSPIALQLLIDRSQVVRTIKYWQEMIDSQTNEYFYYHTFTHDTQWLPPEPYVEFLSCRWPECHYVAKTMHDIHEHYRSIHIWYCPVCLSKISSTTFPECPICHSICGHDPVTGMVVGPDEAKRLIIAKAKENENRQEQQQEEMKEHRMQYWADLAACNQRDGRRKRKRIKFGGNRRRSEGNAIQDEENAVARLEQIDPRLVNIKWLHMVHRVNKQHGPVFAKMMLPLGSLYVGDFHHKQASFDGIGEIMYTNGDRYVGGWCHNIRNGKGIYQGVDGKEYIGDWFNGLRHGLGVLTLPTGECYCGEFVESKYHGIGIYYSANGDQYRGQFVQNKPHGHGIYKKVNGDRFVGTTVNGKAQGYGILTTGDGEVYKGEWDQDYRQGRGIAYYPNGAIYQGEWWKGRWHGHGVYITGEGIRYIGAFRMGEHHGAGKLWFENGDMFDGYFVHNLACGEGNRRGTYRFHQSGNLYVGGWKDNQRHGKGVYTFRDGSQFSGCFHHDHATGKGKMMYSNGNVYEGDFVNGEKHGQGVYVWKNGSKYVGEFRHGLLDGVGTLIYASGHIYKGEWKDNKRHGRGHFTYKCGDTYDGEWEFERRHGHGTFIWNPRTALEESYCGMWNHDKRHGIGMYMYANKTSYEGDWVNGIRQGMATFTWPNGDVYRGQFENEMQHGFGSFHCAETGDVYEGEWIENQRRGQGKIKYANGKVFEGTFFQDKRHGDGIMTYPDGNRYHGQWNQDKKQGGGRYELHVNENGGEIIRVRVFGY